MNLNERKTEGLLPPPPPSAAALSLTGCTAVSALPVCCSHPVNIKFKKKKNEGNKEKGRIYSLSISQHMFSNKTPVPCPTLTSTDLTKVNQFWQPLCYC